MTFFSKKPRCFLLTFPWKIFPELMLSLEKHFNFSLTGFINRKLLCQKEFQRALFNRNSDHCCNRNKSWPFALWQEEWFQKQSLDLGYFFAAKSPRGAGKKGLKEPVISPGFLCFKAEDAKPATTPEEAAAAGRVYKTEWNLPGTFPPLISPVTRYQTADYSEEHKAETQWSMDMLEDSQICWCY